jgi:hypothetical protein
MVICHWSFVLRGRHAAPDRIEVGIESRGKLVQEGTKVLYILKGKQSSRVCPTKPMMGFVERTSSISDETSIVPIGTATRSFGEICADAVRSSYQLKPHSLLVESGPIFSDPPDVIRDRLRKTVDVEVGERSACHRFSL